MDTFLPARYTRAITDLLALDFTRRLPAPVHDYSHTLGAPFYFLYIRTRRTFHCDLWHLKVSIIYVFKYAFIRLLMMLMVIWNTLESNEYLPLMKYSFLDILLDIIIHIILPALIANATSYVGINLWDFVYTIWKISISISTLALPMIITIQEILLYMCFNYLYVRWCQIEGKRLSTTATMLY